MAERHGPDADRRPASIRSLRSPSPVPDDTRNEHAARSGGAPAGGLPPGGAGRLPGPDANARWRPASRQPPRCWMSGIRREAGSSCWPLRFARDTVRELSQRACRRGRSLRLMGRPLGLFRRQELDGVDWQIYRVNAGGGRPERVTRMPGGAMDPAIAAHGELVFSSPVPKAGRLWTSPEPAALYGQMPGQEPSRLTFGAGQRRRRHRPARRKDPLRERRGP